jgi:mono/diheme cytochrome c family protein
VRLSVFFIIAVFVLALPACGGGDDGDGDRTGTLADTPGAKVFADAGCGNCHALEAAGSTGRVGPDLDDTQPDAEEVERQVRNGGGGMPAFEDKLSDQEIEDVAEFVAAATRTATGGSSVAAQFEPDETTVEECDESADFKCYEQAFANIAYKQGPKPALERFDQAISRPGPIEANCHRIVHAIGAGALAHFDGNVGKAFVAGSASCTSGYYHGILERAFLGIDEEKLGPASRRFCAGSQIRTSEFIAYQCVHGLGHGLMIYTGYDMPLSLKTCDRLSTDWDQRSCTGGVFMENLQTTYGARSRWLKENDLLYPCNAVAERHKHYCYDLAPSRILQATSYDWSRAVRLCWQADRGYVETCYQGMGREASGHTRLDPVRILEICRLAAAMARECIHGAAKDMTYTDVSARRAKVLCNTAPRPTRGYCWEGIGAILGSLDAGTKERQAACDNATDEYRRACYKGAGAL